MKWFYQINLLSFERLAKRAGCGRVRLKIICFGHVLIVVRQGRQRRDAAAEGDENSAKMQRGGLSCTVASLPSRQCTFGEFE
jgi:hypothetical protein